MKILIITDAWKPQLNGVVRTYEYLHDELTAMGHEVKVIGPCDFTSRFALPGYKEIELAILPYKRLSAIIEDFSPDTIHIATEATLGRAGRKYCLKQNIPFTTSYHTHFPDYLAKRVQKICPPLAGFVKNIAIKSLRNFHAASSGMMIATQSLEDELRSWNFQAPIFRLTRGVQIDLFYPDPKIDIFADLPKPVALYVGRVAIEKSIEDFTKMEWSGSKVVVGTGPSEEYLKKQYPDVHFVGKKTGEALANHFRSADVFSFPSKTDTFGIVLIEALASGIPVAGYNVTGPRDIITEDMLGALDDDLSKATHKALSAPGTPDERRQHVENYYTWCNAAEQFLTAIQAHKQN